MRRLSRKESNEVDRRACRDLAIPSICLMENAGAGAAAIAMGMLSGRATEALCVCGPGGNGGDAMVVARHLAIAGVGVEVVLIEPPRSADAGVQLAICRAMRLRLSLRADSWGPLGARLRGTGLIVDGIFGTGLTRAPDEGAACAIAAINESGTPVLALDLPSGLDSDTGEPLGACVRADVTATFVAPKLGFANPGSRPYTGEVRIVGIGAPLEWP